jgi:hypothetical protein
MRYLLFLIMAGILFLFCKKQSSEDSSFAECMANPPAIDEATIFDKISGTWKLISVGGGNRAGHIPEVEDVEITLSSDSTYIVRGNLLTSGEGRWDVEVIDNSWMRLNCSPQNMYLNGGVYLCGDKLFFQNSLRDGLDYVFKKAD